LNHKVFCRARMSYGFLCFLDLTARERASTAGNTPGA
jgi:hypothetical protein